MGSEKKLIDADAFLGKLSKLAELMQQGKIREIDINLLIASTPTVDAVEVVHGRWIICSDGYFPYCSECKTEPKHGEMTNYCPNCGAKMDGDGL